MHESTFSNTDPNNEIDEDLEIQAGIVRTAKEDTGVPPPHTPVLTNEQYSAQGIEMKDKLLILVAFVCYSRELIFQTFEF